MATVQFSSLNFKLSVVSPSTTHCAGYGIHQKRQVVAHRHLRIALLSSPSSCTISCESVQRSRSKSRNLLGCRAAGQEAEDSGSSSEDEDFEVDKAVERLLQNKESKTLLDSLAEKVLQDEESKALLKDFATAAERVANAKLELESMDRREKDLAEIVSQMMVQTVDKESEIASLIEEGERAVLAAEEELKAAELALVTARAGGSADNVSRKWENNDIDEDLERIESGKAAAVSVFSGTLASIPFVLTGHEVGIGSLLSIGGVVVSCALFGVTYRYILRRDLGNIQLKSGAAAAFALIRGIGQMDAIQLRVGYPSQGTDEILLAILNASEGLFIFGFSSLALDYCFREAILSPFPTTKKL